MELKTKNKANKKLEPRAKVISTCYQLFATAPKYPRFLLQYSYTYLTGEQA